MCTKPPQVKQEISNELCCLWSLNTSRTEREKEAAQQHRVSQMSCLPATLRGSPTVAVFNSLSSVILKSSCRSNLCSAPPDVLLPLDWSHRGDFNPSLYCDSSVRMRGSEVKAAGRRRRRRAAGWILAQGRVVVVTWPAQCGYSRQKKIGLKCLEMSHTKTNQIEQPLCCCCCCCVSFSEDLSDRNSCSE